MSPLVDQIQELESYLSHLEKSNPKISSSTIGWQIDHCLLVINGIIGQLEVSNPSNFNSKFNFPKFLVFATGKIPRGKARAPKLVNPTGIATISDLKSKIEQAKMNVPKLRNLPKNANFKHPFFGDINTPQTEKFLRIHTHHHLKIIRDILR